MNDTENVIRTTQNTYDQIASQYSAKIQGLVIDSWVGGFEQQLLDKFLMFTKMVNPKVLDIGCGSGKDTNYLRQKGAIPLGIDISSGMLELAKNHVPKGIFSQMDMRNLGFSDGIFDGVWANGCIYHVPKTELIQVFSEVFRVLKPSGIFSFNAKAGSGEKLEANPRSYGGSPRFYAYYTREEMQILLTQVGFKVLEMIDYPRRIFDEEIFHIWACKYDPVQNTG